MRERIDANTAALTARLDAVSARLGALRAHLPTHAQREIDAAQERARAASAAADDAFRAASRSLEQRRAQKALDLRAQVTALVSELAPGSASADLGANGELSTSPLSRYQRVGATDPAATAALSVVAPLTVGSGWFVSGDAPGTADLLVTTLTRLLLQAHPQKLRIHTFDPRSSGTLAPLAGLRAVNAASFPQPHAGASGFLARVEDALSRAPLNAERAALASAVDFADLWARDPSSDAELSVFVLLDYPYGVTPELNAMMQQVANLGPASGTLVLVQESPGVTANDRVDPELLSGLLPRLTAAEGMIRSSLLGDIDVHADHRPSTATIDTAIDIARRRLAGDVGRTVRLDAIIASDVEDPWTRSSLHQIEAVLGVAGREVLPISFRSENPPQSNVLLGGMVGTGKSNALKDLIYSAAVRYSPTELEFVLLDFKAGIEFKSFDAGPDGTGWLPHVSVLGLESDQEYGIAVLRHAASEIDRRSRLFRDAGGASSIIRYREATGATLPRLIIVIDEFHVILEGDEDLASDAADLLELIAKQGRAFGVHLLLASQALTGIRGLRTKADAIFAQFPIRVSLKNSPSESQAFLSQGNRAAADLSHRGEVIVNRNLGQAAETDNIRGLAAYVDPERFAAIQRDLWRRDGSRRPSVFTGSAFAEWNEKSASALARSSRPEQPFDLWIGRPVTVDDAPATVRLGPDVDQLVALVGGDQGRERLAPAVLSAMIRSAAAQLPEGSEFVVLDASGDGTMQRIEAALEFAQRRGHRVSLIAEDRIAALLRDDLRLRIDDRTGRPTTIVFGLGLQRVRGIDEPGESPVSDASSGFTFGAPSAPTARDVIADMARRGALANLYLVGWWSNLAALEQTMGMAHNGVLAYVTVSSGSEDVKKIAGPLTKKLSGSPRVGLHDRRSDVPLRPVVPYGEPSAAATRDGGDIDA